MNWFTHFNYLSCDIKHLREIAVGNGWPEGNSV